MTDDQLFNERDDMDIQDIQTDIRIWADSVYPNRTIASALLKLYGEVAEIVETPDSPGEYADVMIILMDLASMHNVDIGKAIMDKMQVNYNRSWAVNPITGVMDHVKNSHMHKDNKTAYDCGVMDSQAGYLCCPESHGLMGVGAGYYIQGFNNAAGEIGA